MNVRAIIILVLVVLSAAAIVTAVDVPSLPSLPSRRFFIGGKFDHLLQADGSRFNANNFAYYEDDMFGTYGNGTNGEVHAISIDLCRNVYIGGSFDTVDGVATGPIAKYNFLTNKWIALGTPQFSSSQTNTVLSITTDCVNIPDIQKKECNCDVYIAGNFRMSVGSTLAQNVAKFTAKDNAWDALNSGNQFTQTARVIYKRAQTSVTDADDLVWVGGDFGLTQYQLKNKIWKDIDMKGGKVHAMYYTIVPLFWKTDSLVVAGSFSFSCANGGTCTNVASYDRSSGQFGAMGSGDTIPVGTVNTIDMTKGDAYIGGTFVNGPFSYVAFLKDGATTYSAISGSEAVVQGPAKYLKACGYSDVGCTRGSFAVAGSTLLKGDYLAFYDAEAGQWAPFGNSTQIPSGNSVNVVEFAVTNSGIANSLNLIAVLVFTSIVSLLAMNM